MTFSTKALSKKKIFPDSQVTTTHTNNITHNPGLAVALGRPSRHEDMGKKERKKTQLTNVTLKTKSHKKRKQARRTPQSRNTVHNQAPHNHVPPPPTPRAHDEETSHAGTFPRSKGLQNPPIRATSRRMDTWKRQRLLSTLQRVANLNVEGTPAAKCRVLDITRGTLKKAIEAIQPTKKSDTKPNEGVRHNAVTLTTKTTDKRTIEDTTETKNPGTLVRKAMDTSPPRRPPQSSFPET